MPPLDRDDVTEVRASWREIAPHASWLGATFYDALFAADPSLVPLFGVNARGEMGEQGGKLMQMLEVAVDGLADPSGLAAVLRALGERHAAYGVEDRHYRTVGDALLQTLALGLGRRFTPARERAWAAVYATMAEAMISGARRVEGHG